MLTTLPLKSSLTPTLITYPKPFHSFCPEPILLRWPCLPLIQLRKCNPFYINWVSLYFKFLYFPLSTFHHKHQVKPFENFQAKTGQIAISYGSTPKEAQFLCSLQYFPWYHFSPHIFIQTLFHHLKQLFLSPGSFFCPGPTCQIKKKKEIVFFNLSLNPAKALRHSSLQHQTFCNSSPHSLPSPSSRPNPQHFTTWLSHSTETFSRATNNLNFSKIKGLQLLKASGVSC